MIIVSKNNDQLINMDNVANIYIKGAKMAVNYTNGTGSCIGEYQTPTEAKTALLMVFDSITQGFDTHIPQDDVVKGRLASQSMDKTGVHHYAGGKKSKGYGGS